MDRRNLLWMQAQSFNELEKTLLLDRWIRRVQTARDTEMYKMRHGLLTHDTSTRGLLSFSGRGLYE